MYKSFQISNFRGFKTLAFDHLDHLNLIAGKNNAGKTALLEALFLATAAVNPGLALSINSFRGMERVTLSTDPAAEQPWDSIFHEYDRNTEIRLGSIDRDGKARTVTVGVEPLASTAVDVQTGASVKDALIFKYTDEGQQEHKITLWFEGGKPKLSPVVRVVFPTIFLSARRPIGPEEDARRFGALQVEKQERQLIESLKCIEPRLRSLSIIPRAGESMLHGDIGTSRLVPLPLMGEGAVRLTTILLAIASAPNGAVLIDEVENGLHHTILVDVWTSIGKMASEFYTQVFATTHSLECIQAAHKAFKGATAYEFRVHRLDRKDSKTSVTSYDQDTLDAAIESGLEVR